jgi:hypothetical protein
LTDEVLSGILTDEVLPRIFTIMFIQKWWTSARYFDYHVYTEMMKFCQVFWLSCLNRNHEALPGILTMAELHHFCINMIIKIPGRISSFLYKHDSENTWQDFISQNTWQNFICQNTW